MCTFQDSEVQWSLFGLEAASWFLLLQTIADFFFAGPHRWRVHASRFGKKYSRLLRLLVARLLFDYQQVIVMKKLEELKSEASFGDYLIVRHLWDETQSLVLMQFSDTGLCDEDAVSRENDLYESVTAPTLLQIGGFKT